VGLLTLSEHPFAALTPDRVLTAVESLGFDTDARFFALNSYENRVYQIGLLDGTNLIAKFYRPNRWDARQIREEHAFTQELFDLEIPVVPPMKLARSETHVEVDGFVLALFPQLIGRTPELDDLGSLFTMGRFVARMHAIGAKTCFDYRQHLTLDAAQESSYHLLENDFLPSDLNVAYETLVLDLFDRMSEQLASAGAWRPLRIHGDCHLGNVLWHEGTPHFVDFDDTVMGPAIQDLWMLLSGDRDHRQAQLLELAEGYNEFYDFRVSELRFIEILRTMRLINYSAWLARRWNDPAFPLNFPWFNTQRYWADHILELREQIVALDEPTLQLI
tara:strand:- start:1640 stop:2635 length:996 start_codon:yes stop_codon:yes gene_type:complete